jgi:hypothetical protein
VHKLAGVTFEHAGAVAVAMISALQGLRDKERLLRTKGSDQRRIRWRRLVADAAVRAR